MQFEQMSLQGMFLVQPEVHSDARGEFYRYFCKQEYAGFFGDRVFVQMNHSVTNQAGTIRGMHYQEPPRAEFKLIKCIRGRVYDVAVDLRKNSPTFLQWTGVELSAQNRQTVAIPEGFAHGFQALEDQTELLYYHTEYYSPEWERGIRYDDPAIGIQWPCEPSNVSEKDSNVPRLTADFRGVLL